MTGSSETRHRPSQSTADRSLSRRDMLRTTAIAVGGPTLASRIAARGRGAAVQSQGRLRWEQTYRGDEPDHGFLDSCVTADGGIVLVGATSQSQQSAVPWAVKIDPDGRERWNRTYSIGDDAAELFIGAFPADDGGAVLIGGRIHAFGDDETQERGDRDVFVRKIDAEGRRQWTETHGGSDIDWAYSGVALSDSGYLFCGYTYSYTESSRHDLWARKVDADGRRVWDRTIGTDPSFFANDAAPTDDGGAVLAGGRWYENASGRNHLVVKLDRNGNVAWQRTFGSTGVDSSAVAVVGTDDGYAFAGADDDTGVLYGLTEAGREAWQLSLGSDLGLGALRYTGDGRFLVGGQQALSDTAVRWLGMVSAEPSLAWEETYEAGDIQDITAVDGTTLVAGQSTAAGWAGAIAGTTDDDANEETATAVSDDEASTDRSTDGFAPGFGPLAALAGLGIGVYRQSRRDTDE